MPGSPPLVGLALAPLRRVSGARAAQGIPYPTPARVKLIVGLRRRYFTTRGDPGGRFDQPGAPVPGRPHRRRRDRIAIVVVRDQAASLSVRRGRRHRAPALQRRPSSGTRPGLTRVNLDRRAVLLPPRHRLDDVDARRDRHPDQSILAVHHASGQDLTPTPPHCPNAPDFLRRPRADQRIASPGYVIHI